jgi:hypothetical protein
LKQTGTYALKAGPQTLLSQWVVSLDENISDDDGQSRWEDAQQTLDRDDLYVSSNQHQQANGCQQTAAPVQSQQYSFSSKVDANNNNNIASSVGSAILTASKLGSFQQHEPKNIYETNSLMQSIGDIKAPLNYFKQDQKPNKSNYSMNSMSEEGNNRNDNANESAKTQKTEKDQTDNSNKHADYDVLKEGLIDPFQKILNQILADNNTMKALNEDAQQTDQHKKYHDSDRPQHKADFSQIKYLKNYNIAYYPSDFVNYMQQHQLPDSLYASQVATTTNSKFNEWLNSTNNQLHPSKIKQENEINTKGQTPNLDSNNNNSKGNLVQQLYPTSSSSSSNSSSTHSSANLNENKAQKTTTVIPSTVNRYINPISSESQSPIVQSESLTNLKSVKSLTNLYESKLNSNPNPNTVANPNQVASSPRVSRATKNTSPPIVLAQQDKDTQFQSKSFSAFGTDGSYFDKNSRKPDPSIGNLRPWSRCFLQKLILQRFFLKALLNYKQTPRLRTLPTSHCQSTSI